MLCHLPEGGREEREDKDRNKHREAIKGKLKGRRERERRGRVAHCKNVLSLSSSSNN